MSHWVGVDDERSESRLLAAPLSVRVFEIVCVVTVEPVAFVNVPELVKAVLVPLNDSVPLLVRVVPVPTVRVVPVAFVVSVWPLSIVSLPALLAVRVIKPTEASVTDEEISVSVPLAVSTLLLS